MQYSNIFIQTEIGQNGIFHKQFETKYTLQAVPTAKFNVMYLYGVIHPPVFLTPHLINLCKPSAFQNQKRK